MGTTKHNGITIVTDNRYRIPVSYNVLPPKQQEYFNYMLDDDDDSGSRDIERFVKFREWWYDIFDVENFDSSSLNLFDRNWNAYNNDSAFSGVVFHITGDDDGNLLVKCGRFYV